LDLVKWLATRKIYQRRTKTFNYRVNTYLCANFGLKRTINLTSSKMLFN